MSGETRQKILEAAEYLVKLKGMARVTTREIARETGLSEGALYRHFAHKEEVFFEILLKHLPSFLHTLETHVAGTGTITENLEAIALASIHYYGKLLPIVASFFADTEMLTQYQKLLDPMDKGPHTFFEIVATYIQEEQQLGRIKQHISAMNLTILLVGPCFQYTFLEQITGKPPFGQTDQEFVRTIVQSLAPGYFSE